MRRINSRKQVVSPRDGLYEFSRQELATQLNFKLELRSDACAL
jgi:hypothetical protein